MKFQPPTSAEVHEYAASIGFELDGEAFVDYYETRGWRPNGCRVQMKSWKAAVRTWKRHAKKSMPKPKAPRLCECGCGKECNFTYGSEHYFSSKHRDKVKENQ